MIILWKISLVISIVLALLLQLKAKKFVDVPDEFINRGTTYEKPYNITKTASLVRARYPHLQPEYVKDKLAVMIIFNYKLQEGHTHKRIASLVCSLNNIYKNIAHTTPIDIYLWMNQTSIPFLPIWLIETFPEVMIIPIDEDSWKIPSQLSDHDTWSLNNIHIPDYYIMGRWRMTFQFDFVKSIGYNYMLQIDDDAFIIQNNPTNLIHQFHSNGILLGHRRRIHIETNTVTIGLLELVKFWMISRQYYNPSGNIYNTTIPRNISGISSENWNYHSLPSYFMLYNVNFWFDDIVQNFLNLVFTTNSDILHRWGDQTVMNIIKLLFIKERNIYLFHQHFVIHRKVHDAAIFRLFKCDHIISIQPLSLHSQGLIDYGIVPTIVSETSISTIANIEFINLWEVNEITTLKPDFTLFRWLFNTTGCGSDTATLYNYKGVREMLQVFERECVYEVVRERLDALIDSGGGSSSTDSSSNSDGSSCSNSDSSTYCSGGSSSDSSDSSSNSGSSNSSDSNSTDSISSDSNSGSSNSDGSSSGSNKVTNTIATEITITQHQPADHNKNNNNNQHCIDIITQQLKDYCLFYCIATLTDRSSSSVDPLLCSMIENTAIAKLHTIIII